MDKTVGHEIINVTTKTYNTLKELGMKRINTISKLLLFYRLARNLFLVVREMQKKTNNVKIKCTHSFITMVIFK